eukprot:3909542-Alexandrium_andersonii.AAC.1
MHTAAGSTDDPPCGPGGVSPLADEREEAEVIGPPSRWNPRQEHSQSSVAPAGPAAVGQPNATQPS